MAQFATEEGSEVLKKPDSLAEEYKRVQLSNNLLSTGLFLPQVSLRFYWTGAVLLRP